jgi:hypothetical protein
MRRSPSFFSSRSGFAAAWEVVAELDCADRVCNTQTTANITAGMANVVLTELEFMGYLLSWGKFVLVEATRHHLADLIFLPV